MAHEGKFKSLLTQAQNFNLFFNPIIRLEGLNLFCKHSNLICLLGQCRQHLVYLHLVPN